MSEVARPAHPSTPLSDSPAVKTSGVIWITGYSGAGKTTVGRLVQDELRRRGVDTIFLDGDDLRRVFARRWGYERDERAELARVYFRLSSYLASQGHTVVIAAIAMYDEVREWLRVQVPGTYEVYLDVPEAERLRRDSGTKRVYGDVRASNAQYDPPTAPDLAIANFDATSPSQAASEVVDRYLADRRPKAMPERGAHWQRFYREHRGAQDPSPFAVEAAGVIGDHGARILEIGCGNGRDARYFASLGHDVVAVDASPAAIEVARSESPKGGLRYVAGKFPDIGNEVSGPFDVAYSRFVLHAMTQPEQDEALLGARDRLVPGGRLFVECRSINDPLAREGEVISPTERVHGHYRRFIVLHRLLEDLAALGFTSDSVVESTGLARYGDEDPVIIRVHASLTP